MGSGKKKVKSGCHMVTELSTAKTSWFLAMLKRASGRIEVTKLWFG